MTRHAVVAAAVAVVVSAAAFVLEIAAASPTNAFASIGEVVFPIVGVVIARSRPRNTIAWTFLVSGMLNAINHAGQGVADLGQREGWPAWVQAAGAWCTGWTWFPALFVLLSIGLLHFPTGRPVSPRWRWLDKVALGAMVTWVVTVGLATTGLPASELQADSSPHPHGWRAAVWLISYVAFLVIGPVIVMAVVSLVVRWRRSGPIEKLQIRWFAAAGTFAVLVEIALDVLPQFGVHYTDVEQTLAETSAFALIAIAAGFAILRYRLYDIDRIISRTLGYGLITALLGSVYVGIVAGASSIIPPAYGSIGVAAATLTVAALFVPIRRRVQRMVDHRFNRARYNARHTVEAFASAIRTDLSQTDLTDRLLSTVYRAVAPTNASVWLAAPARRG